MSQGGAGWGARTAYGIKVTLHLYDLSPVNEALQPIGLGVYHTGVSIGGSEWTFAGGAGIFSHEPREPGGNEARFREAVDMGMFEGGQAALNDALSFLKREFGPDGYNIMTNNCNHFSDALCRRLLQRPIPSYINRLANVGGCMAGCLPQSLLAGTPVGGGNGNQIGSGSSSGGGGAYQAVSSKGGGNVAKAFAGTGMSLGGGNTLGSAAGSSTSTSSGSSSDLQDRREKTRQARLARLGSS